MVKDISSKGAGVFKRLASFFGEFVSRLAWVIAPAADSILDKIPPGKRKLLVLSAGGTVLLFIFIVILLLARNLHSSPPVLAGPAPAVPGDEFFLPGEPDFVPGFLPGREVKRPWTAEDAAPFWKDPLAGREDLWREEMSAAIDELMETVP